jgi:hypothetical protein
MWSRLLLIALLVTPNQVLAGVKEKVAALAPSALVYVTDAQNNPAGCIMLASPRARFSAL